MWLDAGRIGNAMPEKATLGTRSRNKWNASRKIVDFAICRTLEIQKRPVQYSRRIWLKLLGIA